VRRCTSKIRERTQFRLPIGVRSLIRLADSVCLDPYANMKTDLTSAAPGAFVGGVIRAQTDSQASTAVRDGSVRSPESRMP
jgi:hypothetical protein